MFGSLRADGGLARPGAVVVGSPSPAVLLYISRVFGRSGGLCTAWALDADETLAEEAAYDARAAAYRPRGLFLNLAPVATIVSFKRMA
jgi:hypothetical protein